LKKKLFCVRNMARNSSGVGLYSARLTDQMVRGGMETQGSHGVWNARGVVVPSGEGRRGQQSTLAKGSPLVHAMGAATRRGCNQKSKRLSKKKILRGVRGWRKGGDAGRASDKLLCTAKKKDTAMNLRATKHERGQEEEGSFRLGRGIPLRIFQEQFETAARSLYKSFATNGP